MSYGDTLDIADVVYFDVLVLFCSDAAEKRRYTASGKAGIEQIAEALR